MIKLFKLAQVSVAIYIAILVFTETEDNSAHYLIILKLINLIILLLLSLLKLILSSLSISVQLE